MITIIHASKHCAVTGFHITMKDVVSTNKIIALVGEPGAFDNVLPDAGGQIGRSILRVTHLQPRTSAFEVLADCARLFQQLLSEHLGSLQYLRAGSNFPPGQEQEPESKSVVWSSGEDGFVTAFRLAPVVASSPLLMALTADLAARPMSDERRFAFLANAFEGI
jgi:hypothetical protein